VLLALLPPTAKGASAAPERLEGFGHLYRPASPATGAVLLLPDRHGDGSAWSALAESLAARGMLVSAVEAPALAGPATLWGPSDPVGREIGAAAAQAVERAGELRRLAPGLGLALGGAGSGAVAALVAAARLAPAPVALLLVSPEDAGLPDADSALAGPAGAAPILILVSRQDPVSAEPARRIFLAAQGRSELWELDGAEAGPELLRRAPLAGDAGRWIARILARGASQESPEARR
jgi:alpha-beta hydrolase superfamily lysophospholipase